MGNKKDNKFKTTNTFLVTQSFVIFASFSSYNVTTTKNQVLTQLFLLSLCLKVPYLQCDQIGQFIGLWATF